MYYGKINSCFEEEKILVMGEISISTPSVLAVYWYRRYSIVAGFGFDADTKYEKNTEKNEICQYRIVQVLINKLSLRLIITAIISNDLSDRV